VLDGGLRYRLYLRPGVRFVDDACFPGGRGRVVTAADVVYSLTRLALPATAASGSWLLSGVVQGVDSVRRGQATRISGLSALNDSTVELRLAAPRSALLRLLTLPYAAIVPREAVERYGKDFARHPVGTGPFRLKHWHLGRSLVLLRNSGYWQAGLPRLQAVAVRFMPSRLTAFIEFKQGRLDFLEGLDPTFKDELLTPGGQLQPAWQRRARLQVAPQLATEYVGIRLDSLQTHPLLRQAWFRRALSLAIDRPKLVRYLYNTQADAALHTFIPVGLGVGDRVLRYAYRPQEADSLLRVRGYAGGGGVPPLRLLVSPGAQQLGEFLQQAWQDLGLTVELQTREGATARELIYRGQAELWRASWVADHPDAENFYLLFACDQLSPDGPNTTHHCAPDFDALLQRLQGDGATSPSALEDRLATTLPVLPLFHYRTLRLLQPSVRHLPTERLTGRLDLRRVVKDR
jgi:peptide/nickel transport system substrate-binding protein